MFGLFQAKRRQNRSPVGGAGKLQVM